MTPLSKVPASLIGVVIGLTAIGSATYLASTGAISGGDAIAVIGVVLGGGIGVGGAHVGGTVATAAAGAGPPSTVTPPSTAATATAPGPPAAANPSEVIVSG